MPRNAGLSGLMERDSISISPSRTSRSNIPTFAVTGSRNT